MTFDPQACTNCLGDGAKWKDSNGDLHISPRVFLNHLPIGSVVRFDRVVCPSCKGTGQQPPPPKPKPYRNR